MQVQRAITIVIRKMLWVDSLFKIVTLLVSQIKIHFSQHIYGAKSNQFCESFIAANYQTLWSNHSLYFANGVITFCFHAYRICFFCK